MKKNGLAQRELEVMKILWESSPLTVYQVVEQMEKENKTQWAYTTAGTTLRRMEKKGYVRSEKKSQAFYYYPVLKPDEVDGAVSLVEKYFQGSIGKFMAAFSKERNLTREEIEEIKERVKQHDDYY